MSKVLVDAVALRKVLIALNSPPHHIRELQALRDPPFGEDNPINRLVADYEDTSNHVRAYSYPLASEMEAAMTEFVRRVGCGEVRSVKTYAKFKDILARLEAARGKG
jgi:hypothetical protein